MPGDSPQTLQREPAKVTLQNEHFENRPTLWLGRQPQAIFLTVQQICLRPELVPFEGSPLILGPTAWDRWKIPGPNKRRETKTGRKNTGGEKTRGERNRERTKHRRRTKAVGEQKPGDRPQSLQKERPRGTPTNVDLRIRPKMWLGLQPRSLVQTV